MVVKLVKAEEVQKYIKDYGRGAIEDGKATLDPVDDIVALAGILDLMPGVDAVPVVYGKWERKDCGLLFMDIRKCTICNHKMVIGGDNFKYCPNCGAKMEGVSDDG